MPALREPCALGGSERCAHIESRMSGRWVMLIRKRRGWELPDRAATDEAAFRDRRRLIQGLAAGPILAAGIGSLSAFAADADPPAGLYPAKRSAKYVLDRPLTDEKYSTTYNN